MESKPRDKNSAGLCRSATRRDRRSKAEEGIPQKASLTPTAPPLPVFTSKGENPSCSRAGAPIKSPRGVSLEDAVGNDDFSSVPTADTVRPRPRRAGFKHKDLLLLAGPGRERGPAALPRAGGVVKPRVSSVRAKAKPDASVITWTRS